MINGIKEKLSEHISDNSIKYFFLMLCFVTGIACGALFVGSLPAEKSDELMAVVSSFCNGISDGEMRIAETFRHSMANNFRAVILVYICGMSFYLIPLIYIHMAVRGFAIGFTVGFMSLFFGGKGFLFVIVSVLPQSIVMLPAVAAMSVISHNFALQKMKTSRRGFARDDKKHDLLKYTYAYLVICFVNILSAVIDTFVIPVFVKAVSGLF